MNPIFFRRSRKQFLAQWILLAPLTVAILLSISCGGRRAASDDFTRLMVVGKEYLEKGDATKAIDAFGKAVAMNPTHPDARLNLANAYLRANQSEQTIQQAQEILQLDPESGAAHYLVGCAHLRLARWPEAIQALQTAKRIDRTVNAVSFQLGRAFQGAGQFQEAAEQFEEVVQFEPDHPAAYYTLSQVLLRLGKQEEANQALTKHREILAAKAGGGSTDVAALEKCVYTEARVPFVLEQPAKEGIKVVFSDVTAQAFGTSAASYRAPIGILDINHRGTNDLLVLDQDNNLRLLMNSGGTFEPKGEPHPGTPGAKYSRCLVGDLNADRYEDVIVIGDKGLHALRFATNGAFMENTAFAGLKDCPGVDGILVDLDFTGKLDLLLVPPETNALRLLRNLGNMYFKDITATSAIPALVSRPRQLWFEDWNNDDLMDLFVAREGGAPALWLKERGGSLTNSTLSGDWPHATALATGDLNNDLRSDVVLAATGKLQILFNGLTNQLSIALGEFQANQLYMVDYDNDGWLDLAAAGKSLRVWRNQGNAGFKETTSELGLNKLAKGAIDAVAFADFDTDGDTDFLVSNGAQGLQLLRNDGGNANHQVKLRLIGNRSNPSGIGVRIEVTAGRWRTIRTVAQLPIEIGVGQQKQLDSVNVRWFDTASAQVEMPVDPLVTQNMTELFIQSGSCPYLYAWDGERFRFVTDLLGAAPLGLPVAPGIYIEADPDEYVWIGNETSFPKRDDEYVLQITEELREVLYLDEARLVIVDHPPDTEIYPTDKLLPRKPFPPGELVTLQRPRGLRHAMRSDGLDVTEALQKVDERMASPVQMREPQLRGLAEPYAITLDFGPLESDRPLVLALTGWLRFGGGMANIGASLRSDLPFPFPQLEVETADGQWKPVAVQAGAPAGKTKRMMIDLTGELPPQSRRLRLSTAFEIHWDQALLFERDESNRTRITSLLPSSTDLHWRGFSEMEDWPWYLPLTPNYDRVRQSPPWRLTPAGWCTRYGEVDELVAKRDDALVLLNGGDELTLKFAASQLPPKPEGFVRDFFLFTVGWDKDADFHVLHGTTVEPLPFHGMDDQLYGRQPHPEKNAAWISKYNTRWVGSLTLQRSQPPARHSTSPQPLSRRAEARPSAR